MPDPRTIPPLPAPGEAPRGADATAERLLRAAHELLHERGGTSFSVSEVCGRADANVAMVKYCFGNKDGLLMALTTRITASFRSDFERLQTQDMPWREKLERHVAGIVRNYMRYPYINRMLADQLAHADEPGTRELSESFAAPMAAFHRELLEEGRRSGELREIDPMLFFFSVVGMCEFIFTARGWLVHGFGQRLDDEFVDRYVNHVVELVLAGIGASGSHDGDSPQRQVTTRRSADEMTTEASTLPTAPTIAAEAHTLCEAFQANAARRGDAIALRTPDGDEITWREYAERVHAIAAGLSAHGIARGDTVAMVLANRPEGHLVDTAALHLGATPFSVYNTFAPEQMEYVLSNSGARVVVTEMQFADQVLAVRDSLPDLEVVVAVDGPGPGTVDLEDLVKAGGHDFDLAAAWRSVTPDDVATLIYTSGTTGPPKGVELTHHNLLWTGNAWRDSIGLGFDGRLMSYLPMAHLADRVVAHYFAILTGACITCVADPQAAVPAIAGARPTLWLGVPRVWEKIKSSVEAKIGAPPFAAATAAAVRTQLGFPDDTFLLSGGAPLPLHVIEFFDALGLSINEGYGLTESSAVVTMNHAGARRIGTVGNVIPGAEAKLADDGELLVRGPLVMKGYRLDPKKTAEAIDSDGWLHTGDVAQIDEAGFVKIVDRKKELIINAAGKNMSPSNIEAKLKAGSSLIGVAVAIGDARPYNTALIVLEPDAAKAFAAEHDIAASTLEALAADVTVRAEVAAGVERANLQLSRVEQIKRHTIVPGEWLPGGDELTPTLKLKRKPIAEKYASEIEALYAP